jgi:hypothetical protein
MDHLRENKLKIRFKKCLRQVRVSLMCMRGIFRVKYKLHLSCLLTMIFGFGNLSDNFENVLPFMTSPFCDPVPCIAL